MADHSSQDPDGREVRIGKILSDLHERRQRGESIDDEQILSENPDIADELRTHLTTLRDLRPEERSITRLIRQGVLSNPVDPRFRATFGDYQIIDYLGHGGMGVVLKAYDEKLRRIVAIKLLRRELADDDIANARFLREARAAASLAHPNIAGVYAIGEQNGSPFIAMEYVDGPSLAKVIRLQGPLQTGQIRWLFGQLLAGLEAAHDVGLIHRDIKSANLLFSDRNGRCEGTNNEQNTILKIADFGLARITNSQTQLTLDNQSFGTPEYMSPEQARGDTKIDHRVDLYSAGVVLYEMITGRTPFRASTSSAVLRQIIDVAPPDPRTLHGDADPALSSLAVRLMAKKPDDRLASAAAALAVMESHRSIASREARRRRARMGSLVGGCIAVLGLAVWGYWTSDVSLIIDAAPHEGRFVKVQRAGGEWEKTFYQYPIGARVSSATFADIDGRRKQCVFATLTHPINKNILEAVDNKGTFLWGQYSTLTSSIAWPDCAPNKGWSGIQVCAAPLDDEPGDELIVVTSDLQEYPTRVSIMKPANGEILGTFWNIGDIGSSNAENTTVQVLTGFFDDGSSAILIQGMNNKLDGFTDSRAQDQDRWTRWEIVPVVMILDPREIMRLKACCGPPSTNLVKIPQGGVYAYAFANLSVDDKPSEIARTPPSDWEQGGIYGIAIIGVSARPGAPLIKLDLHLRESVDSGDKGAVLNLDRNLNVLNCVITPNPANPRSTAEWSALWVPIIQERKPVVSQIHAQLAE